MSRTRGAGRAARLGGALLVIAVALAGCGDAPPGCPAHPGPINAFVTRMLPAGTGATVLAARGGRVLYCRGFGLADRAARTPAGCDTVYDVMSITKQFTAAAILKLEMRGRLRVGDRIGRFLGPVPADKRPITVHQLLTQTSGLPDSLGDDYAPVSRDELVARALRARPRSAPGREFHYSNVGYSLLAAIIEKASGMPYERFLARYLFRPAGMRHTGYVLPHWRRARVTVEYDDTGRARGRPYEHPWAADGPYWNLRGNGGMLSTAADMFRWHRALLGDRVLSARAKRRLFHPYVPTPDAGESYAYGWLITGTPGGGTAWHDGGDTWSLGVFARSLGDGAMAFWISDHAYQKGRWNLDDEEQDLTFGVLCRARRAR